MNKVFKYFSIIAVLCMAVYALNKLAVFNGYSSGDIKEYLNSFGMLAPIVHIVLFTLVPLTFFPDSILAIAGGMVFGLTKGTIFTMIGALCGGTLSFYITRTLGNNIIKRFIKKDISILGKQLKENGFWVILILRLIPLFPFDVISYSAGLSDIKYKDFFLATLVGTIPGIMVFTNIGDKSSEVGSTGFYISIALLVLLFSVSILLKKKTSILNFHNINKVREENI